MMPGTVVYQSVDDVPEKERFMSFLTQEVAVRDAKGKKTGETRIERLPIHFTAESAEGARNTAIAFWQGEIAKEQAKKGRGVLLGKKRWAA